MNIIDRTKVAAPIRRTRDGRDIFSEDNPNSRRSPRWISGIALHQTAFVTHDLSRCDCLIANYVVMQDGTILFIRDLSMGLNSVGTDQHAIDIEFVGDYPTAEAIARGSTVRPELAQICSGRDLIRYLKSRHGTPYILAHQQFEQKNCPGPHLWYNLGEWAVRNGLRSSGRGRPVPSSWLDPSLAIPGLDAPVSP